MKNQKGITLIALIITIIVLLILSLVTINSIFGNDSAMEKARQARENNEKGEISDMLAMAISNIKLKHAEENKQWAEYYGDEQKFKTAGNIENSYNIYGTDEEDNDKKYSYDDATGIVKLTIKKIGGTGIEYTYELNVTSGNVILASSTPINSNGSNGGNNGSGNGGGTNAEEYTITYNLNDGDFKTGQTLISKYKTGDVVGYPSPIRDGYAFDGWYTSSTFESGTRALQTSKDSTGNITVYAKWLAESKPYYFKYINPDANGNVSITGLTSASDVSEGQVSGEEAYANDADDIINLVIPKKNGTGDDAKTVTVIGSNSFKDRNKITKVCMHSEMTSIGAYSFWGCSELEELIMPITIERTDRCFYNCTKVNKITYTVGPGEDGEEKNRGITYAPWGYSSASSLQVILEEGITKLGNGMFNGLTKLQMVKFPTTLKVLGNSVFQGCTGMQGNLDSLEDIESMGERAFSGCTGITGEITIPAGMTVIPMGLFENVSKIEKVNIHSGVTSIGNYGFEGCTELKEVTMPITIERTNRSFKDCTKIEKITLIAGTGENGTQEQDRGSSNAPWMSSTYDNLEVYISDGITKLGNSMFYNCSKLKSIRIPDSLRILGNSVFRDCSNLVINDWGFLQQLTSLGERAFNGCAAVTGTVELPTNSNITTIQSFVFNSTGITTFIIPTNITELGERSLGYSASTTATYYYRGTEAQWSAVSKGSGTYYTISEYEYTGN